MAFALSIENLTKSYANGVKAVDNVDLAVPRGEFFGFLGPNGAGKTSTIHCVTGIGRITSGRISVFGIDVVKDYREARKKIGLAPQEYNVDIFAKVWKLLDYVAGYYGLGKKERKERVDELLEKFDLMEHKDKAFQHLSGGLKRRVMLVRALVHDPELIILDEPTAGVDVELRHELWRYLRELNQSGKTIVLTSHYLEEVELLCNHIAVINRGKILVNQPKTELLKGGRRLEDIYLKVTKGETW